MRKLLLPILLLAAACAENHTVHDERRDDDDHEPRGREAVSVRRAPSRPELHRDEHRCPRRSRARGRAEERAVRRRRQGHLAAAFVERLPGHDEELRRHRVRSRRADRQNVVVV
jgi:hypothetical protein